MNCMEIKCDIKDIALAEQGENNINWAIKRHACSGTN